MDRSLQELCCSEGASPYEIGFLKTEIALPKCVDIQKNCLWIWYDKKYFSFFHITFAENHLKTEEFLFC